jgi:hypothetical protein
MNQNQSKTINNNSNSISNNPGNLNKLNNKVQQNPQKGGVQGKSGPI